MLCWNFRTVCSSIDASNQGKVQQIFNLKTLLALEGQVVCLQGASEVN